MTTAICFDLDGTLLQFDSDYDDLTADVLTEHLGTTTPDAVAAYNEAFFAAFEALDSQPYRAGMAAALDHATGDQAFDDERVAAADVDALVAALHDRELAATTVPSAARECLDTLTADPEVVVAVVTDGVGQIQREKLRHHDLDGYPAETVVSYEVGGHKESGDPYRAARERLDADEYVMVGDDYTADVEAAREAEFVPVHYDDGETDLFAILRAFL
jgi:putative hydrolase of the HAD superfamily